MNGIAEVVRRLPHRPPFLMIDSVREVTSGVRAVAWKRVSECVPVFPATLMLECMAQTAAIAMWLPGASGADMRLAGITRTRFRGTAVPGDTLVVEAVVIKRFGSLIRVRGRVDVAGTCVALAHLTLFSSALAR